MVNLNEVKTKPELKKLCSLIKDIDAGVSVKNIKHENDEFLKNITPLDIALAEQQIFEENPDYDYSNLLQSHIELLDNPAFELRKKLTPDHYIRKELMEHEMISTLMAEMEALKEDLYKISHLEPHSATYHSLAHIATHFSAARKHFQAEEKILFTQLEEQGIYLYPKLLRQEHEKLQTLTYGLMDILYECNRTDFQTTRQKLTELIDQAIPLKRRHIYKEDNMLYPIAYELIDHFDSWQRLSYHCDLIGYCCF